MQSSEHQPQQDKQIRSRHRSRVVAMASAAAIVVVGLGAFALVPQVSGPGISTPAQPAVRYVSDEHATPPPRMLEAGAPFSFADLVERVSPAVVTVTAETEETGDQDAVNSPDNLPEPFRNFFNQFGQQPGQPQAPHKALSMGSGFIIDKSGIIVTNNHVIDGAKKITVKLPDGRSFEAKLIGTDASTDVAVLRVKSDKALPSVEFGDDRQLRVGDWVIAVGNPFGLSNTVTAGIVSSLGRDLPGSGPYDDFIQIDAPINRGNSGGPTFDLRGQVVRHELDDLLAVRRQRRHRFRHSLVGDPRRGGAARGAWPRRARLARRADPEPHAGDRGLARHQPAEGRDCRRRGGGRAGRESRLPAGRHRSRDQRQGRRGLAGPYAARGNQFPQEARRPSPSTGKVRRRR